MKEKNKFDLVPYISNIKDSGKINSLNQKLVSNIEETIIKIVKKSDAILMHECDQFENFSGRELTLSDNNNTSSNFGRNLFSLLRHNASNAENGAGLDLINTH